MSTLSYLQATFPDTHAITRAEFRQFLGISQSTDCRMKEEGRYPSLIVMAGSEKILLPEFAKFLDSGEGEVKRRPGRPKGSKNKPKSPKITRNSPVLPATLAAELGLHAPQ